MYAIHTFPVLDYQRLCNHYYTLDLTLVHSGWDVKLMLYGCKLPVLPRLKKTNLLPLALQVNFPNSHHPFLPLKYPRNTTLPFSSIFNISSFNNTTIQHRNTFIHISQIEILSLSEPNFILATYMYYFNLLYSYSWELCACMYIPQNLLTHFKLVEVQVFVHLKHITFYLTLN